MSNKWWGIRIAPSGEFEEFRGSFLVAIVSAESEPKALERFQALKLQYPCEGQHRPPQLLEDEKALDKARKELNENITYLYERMGYWAQKWNLLRNNREILKKELRGV